MTVEEIPAAVRPRYALTAHEQVTILSATPERLLAEVRYSAGGREPPLHLHPQQDERFEVLSGALRVTLDGRLLTVAAGESVAIPRGAAHRMAPVGPEGATARWSTTPALRTEQWWSELAALRERCGGDPPLPALARLLREFDGEFRLALPRFVALPPVRLLAALPAGRGA
ncbi:cupin domain-containing protein [Conexibacter sp. JD483]|uniref:cupin domain-containing protein n=1 Tax=unclassified Conexibacter TaxID=2627773 RepID=UPI00271D7709|nr:MULTISPECIES: cupin domain-containing protein [unclassified Conexibacter]MDO8187779.1 cupin domain-containing protein [Conexibacter sp. CPCC 205706]MDO8201388.1 cupin domain-containing protein [Conexibacter sp. CPCC 205762]MDR9372710.1 cupin domain-containing protein [Conexibacter sp. JD483]